MQTLFPVASYLVPPYSPIVHLNIPSQYQLKKHQWWPFSTDGPAAHAYSPVEGMAPGPKVRGMPSSTIGLPEGFFLVDFVTEYSYPSRKIELKGGFVL